MNILNLLLFLPLFVLLTQLIGCAEALPPTKITLLRPLSEPYKITAQTVESSTELKITSEEEVILALTSEVTEFNRTEKAHLDAITAYIEKYGADPVMLKYVRKAEQEKEKKCAKIAGFYQALPKKHIIVSELSKDYSYSCPYVVAHFISAVEENSKK